MPLPLLLALLACCPLPHAAATEPSALPALQRAGLPAGFEPLSATAWRHRIGGARGRELTATVGADGLRIDGEGWMLALRPLGLARGDEHFPAGAARPRARGERLDLERGNLVEWYADVSGGLEQGFDVAAPPSAPAPGEALVVRLALETDLLAAPGTDRRAVRFRTYAGDAALRVHSLSVLDAAGRELEARFDVGPGRMDVVVDDLGAVYPLVVDPIFGPPDVSIVGATPHLNNDFGGGVRGVGDVNGDGFSDFAFQGEPAGSVWVHHGSASGPSLAPDAVLTGNTAGFGGAIAPAGDVNGDGYDDLFVGDIYHPVSPGGVVTGEGLLFLGSPSGLATTPAWTAVGEQQSQATLFALDLAGVGDLNGDGYDDLAVGAPNWRSPAGTGAVGRAYVWLGGPGLPAAQPDWVYQGDETFDGAMNWSQSFGYDVTGAGDVDGDGYDDLLVGMPHYCVDPNPEYFEGRAYLFLGSAVGLDSKPSQTLDGPSHNATFGYDVGRAGDVDGDGYADVLVGSELWGDARGSAALYLGGPGGLAATPAWTRTGTESSERLGRIQATAGDLDGDGYADVVVTRPYSNLLPNPGVAEVYHGSPAGLAATPDWTAVGYQGGDYFGSDASAAGDVDGDGWADLLVAAPLYDELQPFSNEGRVDLFFGGPRLRLAAAPDWQVESDVAGAALGERACFAGDLDGDGFTDLVVAAPGHGAGAGRVRVHLGGPGGPSATPDLVLDGAHAGEAFGAGLCGAGDVNGDGYGDVAVGAPGHDAGGGAVGRVALYLGSPAGLAATPAAQALGDQPGAEFGACVGPAGDVDGDGLADLLVGAPRYDAGGGAFVDAGRATVFLGSAAAPLGVVAWTADGPGAGASFGAAAAAADVDADGFDDLLIGAPGASNGEAGEGVAFLFPGSAGGPATAASWTFEPDVAGAALGAAVGRAGDVDGDGHADLLVGAPGFSAGATAPGAAWLFLGSPAGLAAAPAWTAVGGEDLGEFGAAVACAGDVDGDGFSDLLIGAPLEDGALADAGRVHVFLGSASGPGAAAALVLEGDAPAARLGAAVAGEGDVDGDGVADVLAGAPGRTSGQADEGAAFLHRGSRGLPRAPLQRRVDGSAPIAVGGATVLAGALELSLAARSPAGRRAATLQVETAPAGQPFDGAGVLSAPTPTDTGPAGARAATFAGALPGAHHARLRLVTGDPWFPTTPWTTLPGRAANETTFRVPDPEATPRVPSTSTGPPRHATVTLP